MVDGLFGLRVLDRKAPCRMQWCWMALVAGTSWIEPLGVLRVSLFGAFMLVAPGGAEIAISNRRARALLG